MGLQHKNESYHFHPLDTSGVSWDASGVVITQFSQDHLGYAVFLPLWRAGTQGSEGWVTLKAANLQRAQLWTLTASQTKSSVTPRKMTSRKGPPDMKAAASYSTEIEICKNFRNEEVENYLHFVQGNICTLLQQRWEDSLPLTSESSVKIVSRGFSQCDIETEWHLRKGKTRQYKTFPRILILRDAPHIQAQESHLQTPSNHKEHSV